MKKISETIVFFGSGSVAAESLRLLSEICEIEAVITKSSTLHEMKSIPSLLSTVPIYAVETKQELDTLIEENNYKSRLGVLIDFGIIVSPKVINNFPLGIINSHFSLLPEWRGADPITFSILSGQRETGVSLMLLTAAMDEGPILAYGVQKISPNSNSSTLTDQLIKLSFALLRDMLPHYIEHQKTIEQSQAAALSHKHGLSYSRRLLKQDGAINWNKPAAVIEREIRAYNSWPKSFTSLGGIQLTITKARIERIMNDAPKVGALKVEKKRLFVGTGKDWLELLIVQPAGKKEMPIESFLAGYRSKLK